MDKEAIELHIPYAWLFLGPNYRKHYSQAAIAELAQSIAQDGLLQNLVVCKDADRYRVAAGQRRYLAISLNIQTGKFPTTYAVRCLEVSPEEAERISLVENIQREDVHPYQEAQGFAQLVDKGMDAQEIALRTAKSLTLVRQRLMVAQCLSDEGAALFLEDKLTLTQVQALILLSKGSQAKFLEKNGTTFSRAAVEAIIGARALNVEDALFEPSEYKGSITQDLFGETKPFFADAAQARELQSRAIEALEEHLKQEWAWVAVEHSETPPALWQYGRSENQTEAGVIIAVNPKNLRVEVHKGLVQPKANTGVKETDTSAKETEEATPEATPEQAGNLQTATTAQPKTNAPSFPTKGEPFYTLSGPGATMAHELRSKALQEALLGHAEATTVAKALLVIALHHRISPVRIHYASLDMPKVSERVQSALAFPPALTTGKDAKFFAWLIEDKERLDKAFVASVAKALSTGYASSTRGPEIKDGLVLALAQHLGASIDQKTIGKEFLQTMSKDRVAQVYKEATGDAAKFNSRKETIEALLKRGFKPGYLPKEVRYV